MPYSISDGKQWPISTPSPGAILDLSDALAELVQPLSIVRITKGSFRYQETEVDAGPVAVQGFLAPLRPTQLMIKPEAERAWKWWQLIITTDISLNLDDKVNISGDAYRVLAANDFSAYGYFEYHLVEDFTGDQGAQMPGQNYTQGIYFDGSTSQITLDVSDFITDSTQAVWTLYAPDNTIVAGAVAPINPTTVQITISPAPNAGTYRLVGVSGT